MVLCHCFKCSALPSCFSFWSKKTWKAWRNVTRSGGVPGRPESETNELTGSAPPLADFASLRLLCARSRASSSDKAGYAQYPLSALTVDHHAKYPVARSRLPHGEAQTAAVVVHARFPGLLNLPCR